MRGRIADRRAFAFHQPFKARLAQVGFGWIVTDLQHDDQGRGSRDVIHHATKQIPSLAKDQVHVWRVPLSQNPARICELRKVLSPDEQARANRFHFEKDQIQFIEARAPLRLLLSQYLNANPAELTFSFGEQGKPALANGHTNNELRFNLSRRDGLALIAITCGREIGVDVELVRIDLPLFEMAEVSFSERELTTLRSLPHNLQTEGFYNCWTRKEAYIKARGEGFSFPLKQFDVSLAPGERAKLIEVRGDSSEVNRWVLHDLTVRPGYVAALALEGPEANITCHDWLA
jgi:4'-phosphopantetheinyl transferase